MDTATTAIFACNPRTRDSEGRVTEQCKSLNVAWPATAEQVINSLKQPYVTQTVDGLRQNYDEDVKKWQLPYLCPHYSAFNNDHRAQQDIKPEAFTHQTCCDFDDPEKAPLAIERALALNDDEMSEWKDSVLYIEYSTRKPKAHIWIRMPKGKTIEESQRMFCSDLGSDLNAEPDPQCWTPERLILMTGDEVYRSERWLQPLSDKEIEERREAFLMRGLDMDGRPLKKPEAKASPVTAATTTTTETDVVAPNERTRFIMGECLKEAELTVSNLNEEGGRHNAFKSILSVGATQLLSKGEFIGVARELSPAYSQTKEFVKLVADFYEKYTDEAQKLTQFQRRVFARSRKIDVAQAAAQADGQPTGTPAVVYGDTASLGDIYNSPTPPLLSMKARPRFVKTATGPVPAEAKETAAQAMFPPLGMYCDAKFTYMDNTVREARGNCLIIAGTGGGKDSSTKHMLKHLEAPQKAVDGPNREILEKYKREYNRKQTTDKPERPDVAVQSVAADITKARLSELMADAQGRIIHTRMIEFDQWFAVEGWKPGANCPFTYLKMTDDEDNPFGQERVGSQSITYQGPLSLNWNSSTTPGKAAYYFGHNMTDGPISRLVLATVVDRGLGAPIPKHGKYDEKYDAELKVFIDNLRQVHGEVTCKQAIRMVDQLKKELDDFIVQSGDEVLNNLSRRALAACFRKACLLYAANGKHWEASIPGFCRWSLHYDLYLKLFYFSDAIRNADSQIKTSKRGPRNLLSQIPKDADGVFSYRDAVDTRLKNGKEEDGTRGMVDQWVCRGYIERLEDDKFRLLKERT